jgi:hypothetical protein
LTVKRSRTGETRADAHLAFLDLAEFVAVRVLKFQGLAHSQRFAVHLKSFLSLRVLDPEIVADRNQLLAHLVAVLPTSASPSIFFSFLSSSSSHDCLPFLFVRCVRFRV